MMKGLRSFLLTLQYAITPVLQGQDFQAPPDLKIGQNKSQIPISNGQNIGLEFRIFVIVIYLLFMICNLIIS